MLRCATWNTFSVGSVSNITIGAISGQSHVTNGLYTGCWNIFIYQICAEVKGFQKQRLRLILTSPRGTRSSLLLPRPKDKLATSFEDWPFLSVHYWGEDPTGQWTLQVYTQYSCVKFTQNYPEASQNTETNDIVRLRTRGARQKQAVC